MSCKICPDLITDPISGKKVESLLFRDLLTLFDRKTSWKIYGATALDENFFKDNPDAKKDSLGEVTLNSLKEIGWFREAIDKYGLSKHKRLRAVNDLYRITETTDFYKVSQTLGAISRNPNINTEFTAKLTHGVNSKGQHVYSLEIVPKTAENEAALTNFVSLMEFRDKLVAIASRSGIGMSVVDSLTDDVSGEFDTKLPQRVFRDLFNIIRLNANKSIEERDKASCEELGHAIALIYENGELTKELYKVFERFCVEHKGLLTNILSLQDLDAIELSDNIPAETVGKIIGNVLYNSLGKLISNGMVERSFSRLMNRTRIFGSKLARSISTVFKNTVNVLSNNKYFSSGTGEVSNTEITRALLSAEEYVLKRASDMVNSFLNEELDVDNAMKVRQKLHRNDIKSNGLVSKISKTYFRYVKQLRYCGYITEETANKMLSGQFNAINKAREDYNCKVGIVKNAAVTTYMRDTCSRLAEFFNDVVSSMGVLTEDFKGVCNEALSLNPSRSYDFVSAVGNIATFDTQCAILAKMKLALELCTELNDAVASTLLQSTDGNLRALIKELMDTMSEQLLNFKGVYTTLSKGALCAELIVMNQGSLYINRGARLMTVRGEGEFKKALTDYKGRKILISELLSELRASDGYFDMSWWGYKMQSAGNSVDPITQLLDSRVKENKFNANTENLRFQALLLSLKRQYSKYFGNDYRFVMEVLADGERSGNIIQHTNWGQWEKDFHDFKYGYTDKNGNHVPGVYDLLREEYAEELKAFAGSTVLEAIFLLGKLAPKFKEWHDLHSININDCQEEDLPDIYVQYDDSGNVMFDEYGNVVYRDYSVNLMKNRARAKRESGLVEYDSLEDELMDNLTFSEIKYAPNPNYENGRYKNSAFEKLSAKLKEFIYEYLSLKALLDSKLNTYRPNCTTLYRLPQFRGSTWNRFTGKDGIIGVWKSEVIELVFLDAQDEEFGDNTTYNNDGQSFFADAVSGEKEIRKRIPIFGVNKLHNMKELSTDIFSSTMAYAAMANNVEGLAHTADIAELGLDVLKDRYIEGRLDGGNTHIYQRYEKFVEMQILGQYTKTDNRNIAKSLKKLSSICSLWLLAGRFYGGNVNTGTGLLLILKEADVKEHFTYKQLVKALTVYFNDGIKSNFSEGIAANMRTNKMYRFIAYMDAQLKNEGAFRNMDTQRDGFVGQAMKSHYLMCWYENGDHLIQCLPYIMKAMNTRMYKRDSDGNYTDAGSMWELFDHTTFNRDPSATDFEGNPGEFGDPFSYIEDGERKHYYIKALGAINENARLLAYRKSKANERLESSRKEFAEVANEYSLKIDTLETKVEHFKRLYPDTYESHPYYKKLLGEIEVATRLYEKYNRLALDDSETAYTFIDGDYEEFSNIDGRSAVSRFSISCRDLCNKLHGIYNTADAVALSQSVGGALALTMKKFYLGYANNGFMTSRDSIAAQLDVEGYMQTAYKALAWAAKGIKSGNSSQRRASRETFVRLLGLLAPACGTAVAMVSLHSLILSGICNLVSYVAASDIHMGKYKANLISDGFSPNLANSIKRFFSQIKLLIILRIINSLVAFRNLAFTHDPDDDDDDENDSEGGIDESRLKPVVDPMTGEVYLTDKPYDDDSEPNKPQHRRRTFGPKIPYMHKTKKKKQVNYSDYSLDLWFLELFGIKDYSNRAYAMSGGGNDLKTPGILYTLVGTEYSEKAQKWKKKENFHGDFISAEHLVGFAQYFLGRWEAEQAVFAPTYAVSNLYDTGHEFNTLWLEIIGGLAPIAVSVPSKVILAPALTVFNNKEPSYKFDKRIGFGDFDKVGNLTPLELEYDMDMLLRFIYNIRNYQHALLGNNQGINDFVNNIPIVNQFNTTAYPSKAYQSWLYNRSSR